MAPKKDLLKQEEILQAVVIADSFNVRFGPVTQEKPRVRMLHYIYKMLSDAIIRKSWWVAAYP